MPWPMRPAAVSRGVPGWVPWLAAALVLPFVASASGFGGWLDSGELVAAAVWLGVGHPPGQPLHSWTHYGLGAVLPLGSWPWRLAVGSCLALAVAAAALAVAAARCARAPTAAASQATQGNATRRQPGRRRPT